MFITFHPAIPPSTFSRVYISQEDGSSFCCQPHIRFLILFLFFFIVRPVAVLKIITTNISKYKRAAILYSESSIKTLCRCDNERNNHFPFDLVHLDAQQKTLKDENSWKRRIRIRLVVVVLAVQLYAIQEPSHHVQATFPYFLVERGSF